MPVTYTLPFATQTHNEEHLGAYLTKPHKSCITMYRGEAAILDMRILQVRQASWEEYGQRVVSIILPIMLTEPGLTCPTMGQSRTMEGMGTIRTRNTMSVRSIQA